MKLIATHAFRNPQRKITLENAQHPDHIHKGATFEIGAGSDLKAMRKADPESAELIAMLSMAKCIVDAADTKAVQAVQDEIEVDRKREAGAKQMDASAALTAAGAQFADLIAQARRLAPAAAPARAR